MKILYNAELLSLTELMKRSSTSHLCASTGLQRVPICEQVSNILSSMSILFEALILLASCPQNIRDLTWSNNNNKLLTKSTFNTVIKWTKHQLITVVIISFIKWIDFTAHLMFNDWMFDFNNILPNTGVLQASEPLYFLTKSKLVEAHIFHFSRETFRLFLSFILYSRVNKNRLIVNSSDERRTSTIDWLAFVPHICIVSRCSFMLWYFFAHFSILFFSQLEWKLWLINYAFRRLHSYHHTKLIEPVSTLNNFFSSPRHIRISFFTHCPLISKLSVALYNIFHRVASSLDIF